MFGSVMMTPPANPWTPLSTMADEELEPLQIRLLCQTRGGESQALSVHASGLVEHSFCPADAIVMEIQTGQRRFLELGGWNTNTVVRELQLGGTYFYRLKVLWDAAGPYTLCQDRIRLAEVREDGTRLVHHLTLVEQDYDFAPSEMFLTHYQRSDPDALPEWLDYLDPRPSVAMILWYDPTWQRGLAMLNDGEVAYVFAEALPAIPGRLARLVAGQTVRYSRVIEHRSWRASRVDWQLPLVWPTD